LPQRFQATADAMPPQMMPMISQAPMMNQPLILAVELYPA
jgi:hypothetical protein